MSEKGKLPESSGKDTGGSSEQKPEKTIPGTSQKPADARQFSAHQGAEKSTARMKKERLQRIGNFNVKIRLGQGGMGTVYLCHDSGLDRFVAVKVLREELCSEKQCRDRFLNEARALATVSNPHVVQIYEVEPGETPYFAMEYVEGNTVSELLREQGAFSINEACRIVSEASEGLKAMHDNGIVHRDVTPSNIIIDRCGTAKLVDFGLVAERGKQSEEGMLLGTAHYMAPEQVEGKTVDLRADIYGLGATFYHMITGDAPFSGTDRNKVFAVKLAGDPVAVKKKCPEVSNRLNELVSRMLNRNVENRFQSCEEVSAALKKISRPGRALPVLVILLILAVSGLIVYLMPSEVSSSGTGSVGELLKEKGKLSMDFTKEGMRKFSFSHFVQSVQKGGRLPVVTRKGLHFSRGDYDIFFPPLRLKKLRISGLKFVPARGHMRISFGSPDFFYRSIVCFITPGEREVRFQVIEKGTVHVEKVFQIERQLNLKREFGNGLDLELMINSDEGIAVTFYGSGGDLFKFTVDGDFASGSWQKGVLRIKMSSFPQPYELYVREVDFAGTIDRSCMAHWIAGNDSWQKLW